MVDQVATVCFHDFIPGNEYRAFGKANEAEPLEKVKVVVEYLHSRNVKFHINLVPNYVNREYPEQNISILNMSSTYIQEFVGTLWYMQSRGGTIDVEGAVYQYGNKNTSYEVHKMKSIISKMENREHLYYDEDYEKDDGADFPFYYIQPWLPSNASTILTVPYIMYNTRNYKTREMVAIYYYFYLEFTYIIKDEFGNWIYDPAQTSPLHQAIEEGITDTTGTFYPGLLVQEHQFEEPEKLETSQPFIPAQRLQINLTGTQRTFCGDFNGDGKDDFIVWNMMTGSCKVYLNNITYPTPKNKELVSSSIWLNDCWAAGTSLIPLIADVNGDGLDDLIIYNPASGRWKVALNDGRQFIPQNTWLNNWARKTKLSNWQVMVGDFNGDGKTDILAADYSSIHVALSTGTSFIRQLPWLLNRRKGIVFVGDFNGDGIDDIVIWDSRMGNWYVALSTGTNFIPQIEPWISNWANSSEEWQPLIGDINGDGIDDLIVYSKVSGKWKFAISDGTSFTASDRVFEPWGKTNSGFAIAGDFNGDKKTDIGILDAANGTIDIAISAL